MSIVTKRSPISATAELLLDDTNDSILMATERLTRNSPGDDIANVNFFYDDIVHVLQNLIRC